jgi:hypothetical protein
MSWGVLGLEAYCLAVRSGAGLERVFRDRSGALGLLCASAVPEAPSTYPFHCVYNVRAGCYPVRGVG